MSGIENRSKRGRRRSQALGAMLLVLGALAASGAQAQSCSRPGPPPIPDGASAEQDAMIAARTEVEAFLDKMQGYVNCLHKENQDAAAEADRIVEQWNAQLNVFQSR